MAEPVFTTDWSNSRSYWAAMFADYGLPGKPMLRFLEIGCFEGRTTLWLLENVLTDPTSLIAVIDTFEGSPEFGRAGIDGDSFPRFASNLSEWISRGQVNVLPGRSADRLREMSPVEQFDFIYVDGSHMAADVLTDAVLAWPLLKSGGLICFDDYKWGEPGQEWHERPLVAVKAFVECFAAELVVRHDGYQLVAEKL